MKKITQILLVILLTASSFNAFAWGPLGEQTTCGTNWYLTSNAGWTNSEWYQIIDIDAATLTNTNLPQFTATDGAKTANVTDFGTGNFKTPIYTYVESTSSYVPTSVLWPVNFYLATFAPTMYTSAWSKINVTGQTVSGKATTCSVNDNSIHVSKIFDKPGFIELSRQGSAVLKTPPSRHGYIQIDSLPMVERIQWSYSATSYKRGVKMDINYNDGNGWIPQRWVASDYSDYEGSFSEQGYQFEEMIGKQEDPTSFVSFRIRIWDGDSIHMKTNANDLTEQTSPYSATMTPYDQRQTVRVHQIKVFSGIVPTKAPGAVLSAVNNIYSNDIKIFLSDKMIKLSETANVEVFSYDGRRLFMGKTNEVDASRFSKGIYIVKAVGTSGRSLQKIVL